VNNRGLIVLAAVIAVIAAAAIAVGVVVAGDDESASESTESTPVASTVAEPAPNFDGAPGPASPTQQEDMNESTADEWTYEQMIDALNNPRTPPDPSLFPDTGGGPGPSSPTAAPGGVTAGSSTAGGAPEGGPRSSCRQPPRVAALRDYPYARTCFGASLKQLPAQTMGILFFKLPPYGKNDSSQCTATVANTVIGSTPGNESVLVTAGHCIGFTPKETRDKTWKPFKSAYWLPSFRLQELYAGRVPKGQAAFQRWFKRSVWFPLGYSGASDPIPVAYIPKPWKEGAGYRWDFGAVVVQGHGRTSIMDEIGGLGVSMLGAGANSVIQSYGYPADVPFDGERLFVCKGKSSVGDRVTTAKTREVLGIGCDMTGGSSGGPWVRAGDRDLFVVSVNSYGPTGPPRKIENVMFGPNLNGDHWNTFIAARDYDTTR